MSSWLHIIRRTGVFETLGRRPHHPGLPTGAMACWVGLQLAVLGLAALDVKLWARGAPLSAIALPAMLGAQLAGLSIFLPLLLRDWRGCVGTALSAWPFLAAAALLSDRPMLDAVVPGLEVGTWCAVLGCLVGLAGRTVWRSHVHLVAMLCWPGATLLSATSNDFTMSHESWAMMARAVLTPTFPHDAAFWATIAGIALLLSIIAGLKAQCERVAAR